MATDNFAIRLSKHLFKKNYPGKLSDYQIFGKGLKLKDYKIIGVIEDKENIRKL